MKLGTGINRILLNRETVKKILGEHFKYDTDQAITDVEWDDVENCFVVWFDDKPVAEEAEKEEE